MFGAPDLDRTFAIYRVTPNCQPGLTVKVWRFVFVWGGPDCRGCDLTYGARQLFQLDW